MVWKHDGLWRANRDRARAMRDPGQAATRRTALVDELEADVRIPRPVGATAIVIGKTSVDFSLASLCDRVKCRCGPG